MKKALGIVLVALAGFCLATSLVLSVKVQAFPYRLNHEQGRIFYRMMGLWLGSVALTGVAGVVLVSAGGSKLSTRVGWSCILITPCLFLFVPNSVHSITGATNTCINNLRQIDGAKEQWALEKAVEGKVNVSFGDLAGYLKNPSPKCPEGGVYVIGKIDEAPRCSVAGHLL